MDKDELLLLVQTVLDKEYNDRKNQRKTFQIKKENEQNFVISNHADTLIDIFINLGNDDYLKRIFVKLLSDNIIEGGDNYDWIGSIPCYYGTTGLSFFTLVRLGFVDDAIKALNTSYGRKYTIILVLDLVLLIENNNYFDVKQLTKILEILKSRSYIRDLDIVRENLITKIIGSRYEITKKIVRGVNIEINRDKKTVSDKIKYLQFDEKYNKLLNEIDKFINTDTSDIVNSGMISNLRAFLQDLFIDIAKKIASQESEEIPKVTKTPIGNARNYLKIKLELSDNDHSFINRFIDVLHSEGGHSFTANREYFRLSRNIAIEIVLLLLSKYEKKYS